MTDPDPSIARMTPEMAFRHIIYIKITYTN